MRRKILYAVCVIVILIIAYFLLWPVPIEPVSWKAPRNPGYTGVYAKNDRLTAMDLLDIGNNHGPETVALDIQGYVYAGTLEGYIVRLRPDGTNPENWVDTKGCPLGMDFDAQGNLIVADAFRGLLSVSPDGRITVLSTEADGLPICFADDVDIAADGKIYFTDASTKFGAKQYGGAMKASVLDILEHGGHGRLLVYDPANRTTKTLLKGLHFANGVAVSHDQTYVLVNESGSYRIIRYWISGSRAGQSEPFAEELPGFPDNISRGKDGRFWVAFIFPRMPDMDSVSEKPFMRKILQRIPSFLAPKMPAYGHIVAFDQDGKPVIDLQDPSAKCPFNTSVVESSDYLYIGSVSAPAIGRVLKSKLGL